MQKEVIFADEAAIKEENHKLKSLVPFCQYIYNQFTGLGIPVNLSDIPQIAGQCLKGSDDQFLRNYLRDLLLTLPKYKELANASAAVKAREIDIPDYTNIKKWVVDNWPEHYPQTKGFPINHLEMKKGEIKLLTLSGDSVREKHTQKYLIHDHEAVTSAANKGEHIIIQHDKHHIDNAIGNADDMISDGQQVYDMFKAMGVEVDLNEIQQLLHMDNHSHPSDYIRSIVADKLLAKAGTPTFNGIAINRQKLKDMIEVPDVSHIVTRVAQLQGHWGPKVTKSFITGHVQIKDGKLTYADNFHDELNSKHLHTTRTKHSLHVAAKLMEASKMVIELSDLLGKDPSAFEIPGLKTVMRVEPETKKKAFVGHRIDLDFIRQQELTNAK